MVKKSFYICDEEFDMNNSKKELKFFMQANKMMNRRVQSRF